MYLSSKPCSSTFGCVLNAFVLCFNLLFILDEILSNRQKKAAELKQLIDNADNLDELKIQELKADIKVSRSSTRINVC